VRYVDAIFLSEVTNWGCAMGGRSSSCPSAFLLSSSGRGEAGRGTKDESVVFYPERIA
jgi:hypothetical protein